MSQQCPLCIPILHHHSPVQMFLGALLLQIIILCPVHQSLTPSDSYFINFPGKSMLTQRPWSLENMAVLRKHLSYKLLELLLPSEC